MASNKRVFTLRLSDEVFDKIGALVWEKMLYGCPLETEYAKL